MITLLKKEVISFFSSYMGLVSSLVFFVVIGLFLWVFPTEFNILDSGMASLEPLFYLTPWVYMFFIPAVTMRMFAEEKKEGTIEILMTKPLTEWNIVLAKYFAALTIIFVELIITLVYFISVQYFLSSHSVDIGGFWGSFVGLLLLGGVFASVGLFTSSLSSNQIIAFLLSVVVIFILYLGFDLMSHISALGGIDQVLGYLGIQYHYQSISKGVLDSRDILYFLTVAFLFLYLTVGVLKKRG